MPDKTIPKNEQPLNKEYEFWALRMVLYEINRAEEKHGPLPDDYIYAASVVSMEAGELLHAAVNHTLQVPKPDLENMIEEATQTAAMATRFLHDLLILRDNMSTGTPERVSA